jgi:hypothetical protein
MLVKLTQGLLRFSSFPLCSLTFLVVRICFGIILIHTSPLFSGIPFSVLSGTPASAVLPGTTSTTMQMKPIEREERISAESRKSAETSESEAPSFDSILLKFQQVCN